MEEPGPRPAEPGSEAAGRIHLTRSDAGAWAGEQCGGSGPCAHGCPEAVRVFLPAFLHRQRHLRGHWRSPQREPLRGAALGEGANGHWGHDTPSDPSSSPFCLQVKR